MRDEPPTGLGPEAWPAPPTTDDWTSPMWGRPDTLASYGAGSPASTGTPPPPARRRSRGPLVTAGAALLVVSLLGGVLLSRVLAPASSDVTAASAHGDGSLSPVDAADAAAESGGRSFTASTASQLASIYDQIGRDVAYVVHTRELTATFAGAALLLALLAAAGALVWTQRLV